MRKLSLLSLSLFVILLGSMMLNVTTTASPSLSQDVAPMECTEADATFEISGETGIAFSADKFEAEQGDCLEIVFTNLGTLTHDFTIDDPDGDGYWVHLQIYTPTSANKTAFIQLPDEDVTYTFYCTIPGHEAMEGDLIVGEGSKSDDNPGFGFFVTLAAFGSLFVAMTIRKRKN